MSRTKEVPSPLAAITAGAVSSDHLPLYYPRGRGEIESRAGFSLHHVVRVDCIKNGRPLPQALLDPRDTDCRPGVETLVYAYKFATRSGDIIIVPRPKIKTNARGLVSSSDSPAVLWADGSKIYAFNGVWISSDVYERPESITAIMVTEARSAETRRCMMEHYPGGCKALISEWVRQGVAKIVDRDQDAMGERLLFSLSQAEKYVVVATIDVSNTEKLYLLRVNPAITTCADAVASTFPVPDGFRYAPLVES